jgi:hypothetical protein
VRELREELGVEAEAREVLAVETHDYPLGPEVEITFVRCDLESLEFRPSPAVHAVRWVSLPDLDLGQLPPGTSGPAASGAMPEDGLDLDRALAQIEVGYLKEALKKGAPGDFLGHEGGDDFILLTTPQKAQEVTDSIRLEFDRRIRELLTGRIVGKDVKVKGSRKVLVAKRKLVSIVVR